MTFRKKEIVDKIYLINFKEQKEMCKTFLRFQEFYESPKFRAKVFSLEEFKKWYSKAYGKGRFTYYSDWGGFNIPSWIIKSFEHGLFNPLTEREKELVETFKGIEEPFYVIAVMNNNKRAIKHEISHGLWYINPSYKSVMTKLLQAVGTPKLREHLLKKGYCNEVLDDEAVAYALSGISDSFINNKYYVGLMNEVFDKETNGILKSEKECKC